MDNVDKIITMCLYIPIFPCELDSSLYLIILCLCIYKYLHCSCPDQFHYTFHSTKLRESKQYFYLQKHDND